MRRREQGLVTQSMCSKTWKYFNSHHKFNLMGIVLQEHTQFSAPVKEMGSLNLLYSKQHLCKCDGHYSTPSNIKTSSIYRWPSIAIYILSIFCSAYLVKSSQISLIFKAQTTPLQKEVTCTDNDRCQYLQRTKCS